MLALVKKKTYILHVEQIKSVLDFYVANISLVRDGLKPVEGPSYVLPW